MRQADRENRKERLRPVRQRRPRRPGVPLALAASVIFLFLSSLAVFYGASWVAAQARAAVVLSSVLETPGLTPAVKSLTGEPELADTSVAGNPTTVARPAGEGPWPAIFFVNGTTPEGRELEEVRQLARGMARAGYVVYVPDLPGLRDDEITVQTVAETVEVAEVLAGRSEVRGGEVGLVGVSTGATLAILAAEDARLAGDVTVVAGIAPYTSIRTVISIATTGSYREDGEFVRYEAEPFLSYVIARSLVAALPPGEDRERLFSKLDELDRRGPDPLRVFRERELSPEEFGPEARSVVRLLANRDPGRFDGLYADLPEDLRAELRRLSPLAGAGRLGVPVELASAPEDRYFPVSESYALQRIAPDRQVTVTRALDHANLEFSVGKVPGFLRLNAFAVRSLHAAYTNSRETG